MKWKLGAPPAVCPAEQRAWDKCERSEAYTKQKHQPCCFVWVVLFYCLFLFQQASGEREKYLKIPLLGYNHSWPELSSYWSGWDLGSFTTQQTSLKTDHHNRSFWSMVGHSNTRNDCIGLPWVQPNAWKKGLSLQLFSRIHWIVFALCVNK